MRRFPPGALCVKGRWSKCVCCVKLIVYGLVLYNVLPLTIFFWLYFNNSKNTCNDCCAVFLQYSSLSFCHSGLDKLSPLSGPYRSAHHLQLCCVHITGGDKCIIYVRSLLDNRYKTQHSWALHRWPGSLATFPT